jgi:molybdopterin synthase catalytic subunit
VKDTFRVTARPLSIDAAYRGVRRPECGAVCLFVGIVRETNEGKRVKRMRYSSFAEMAEREFGAIAKEARRRWKVGAVWIAHRTGTLEIGDPSVVIAVSSPHRAESFAACRFAIERLKRMAPIWKEEFYAAGKAWISGH